MLITVLCRRNFIGSTKEVYMYAFLQRIDVLKDILFRYLHIIFKVEQIQLKKGTQINNYLFNLNTYRKEFRKDALAVHFLSIIVNYCT